MSIADAASSATVSSIAPVAPANDTTPPIIKPTNLLLDPFLSWKDTTDLIPHHRKRFQGLNKELHISQMALFRLNEIAKKNPPRVTLPKQLQLHITKNVKLPPVDGHPQFFKVYMDKLQQIEEEANKQIYQTLKEAREHQIKHFTSQIDPTTFVTATMKEIKAFIDNYADTIDSTIANSKSSNSSTDATMDVDTSTVFPKLLAHASLEASLTKEIYHSMSEIATTKVKDDAAKNAKRIEDLKAQEKVHAGMHSGDNIAMIATKAAQSVVSNGIKNIKSQLASLHTPTPAASPASSTKAVKFSLPMTHNKPQKKSAHHPRNPRIIQEDSDAELSFTSPTTSNFRFHFNPNQINVPIKNKATKRTREESSPASTSHRTKSTDDMDLRYDDNDDDSPVPQQPRRSQPPFQGGGGPSNTFTSHPVPQHRLNQSKAKGRGRGNNTNHQQ